MPVFVSYSFQDEVVYSVVKLALEAANIKLWESTSMAVGVPLASQLREAIHHCEVCIFIATRRSIESPWCLAELGAFWGTGKRVLIFMADPDLTEDTLPPQFKGDLRVGNAHELKEGVFNTLAQAERARAEIVNYDFFKSCGEYGTEQQWSELVDQSRASFAVLGNSLSNWRRIHQFDKRVLARADAGCQLKFLLMHPDNPLIEGILYKGRNLSSVKPLISESIDYFEHLQADHENIEVRHMRSGIPHFSLVRADDCLVVTQYLVSETWGSGPTWRCFEGSPLFDVAMNDFKQLWNESERGA